ncbi:NAD(P)-dependent dehydrogenase (short-subunit alcohol dehydrogenase family) [Inhella inkyongensis]|uniref:NAD(P)-dependent dehydrogenase (Short-subunit alcohol dehydrogenase family) n=1 Tax=Inhella inkyongensis TaxID=392593 RepID=A0A840RYH9_9BURK|nr:SDR family NAD(P)-dependent oxidoreductase [Inhella inkyongensis]MBB5203015.1 NAD(P)-dependent dehydrogenase (short-subunit alcohol dehydrogenase family) [Inhella inkyongensis]
MSLNPKFKDWHGKTVWLVGASTGIGAALAHALHARGATVAVSARGADKLEAFAQTHPGALALPADVLDRDSLASALRTLVARTGRVDLALFCAGAYTPLRADQFDLASATQQLQTNYQGALNWLDVLLPQLLGQAERGQGGHISLVSSVAGYRGLPKALGYGPAKAALIHLAETLYLDLAPKGLGVSIVNPGFVATPMTAQNDFPMPALQTPEQAAEAILEGWADGDFEIHFPKRFTRFVKFLRHLPARPYFWLVRKGTRL